jgi:hypothetical protein
MEKAEDIIGYTSKPFPSLYWYLDKVNVAEAELSIELPDGSNPIKIPQAIDASRGLQRAVLSPANHPGLTQGMNCRWWITLIQTDGQALDVGGDIRYLPLNAGSLPDQSCRLDASCLAEAYAREGYWYDAIATLLPTGQMPKTEQERLLLLQLLSDIGFTTEEMKAISRE